MKKSLLKKIVSCALVSSMAFAVAACSESTDETVANNEDAQETAAEEVEDVEETTVEETVTETEVTFEGTEITETVEVNGWSFNVSITVPDGADYEFVSENPTEGWYLGGDGATGFISGDACFSFIPVGYPSSIPDAQTFAELAEVMLSDENPTTTQPISSLVIGGRDALCFEWSWGDGLHGYKYWIDASDALGENGSRMYIEVRTLPLDAEATPEAIEALYSDATVQNIINSITITAA